MFGLYLTVMYIRNMKKIEINTKKMIELYNHRCSDSEIARHFNCHAETIRNKRKELNLPSNQGVTVNGVHIKQTAVPLKVLKPFVDQGLSDYTIGDVLGLDSNTIRSARKFYKLERESLVYGKAVKPTQRQLEILIGHILGDGSLRRDGANTTGKISQGIAQLDYATWKANELKPLAGEIKVFVRKTADHRTGIHYSSADAHIYANPELNWLYYMFYATSKKELNEDLIEYITPLSLAVWFMDDGFLSTSGGYCIATQSFNRVSLIKKIFSKFGIEVTVTKAGITYIKKGTAQRFVNFILPHIHDTLRYKLHRSHVTPLIQGKP